MCEYKYYNRRGPFTENTSLCFGRHFENFDLPSNICNQAKTLEPGIFIVGGIAREAALVEITQIDKAYLPKTLDCDLMTFREGGVYRKGDSQPLKLTYSTRARGVVGFLDIHTAINLDQVLCGSPKKGFEPNLYATTSAVQGYKSREITIPPFNDERNRSDMLEFSAVCRGLVISCILREQGFKLIEDNNKLIDFLRKSWRDPRSEGKLRSAVLKAHKHGVLEEVYEEFLKLGFTINQKIMSITESL